MITPIGSLKASDSAAAQHRTEYEVLRISYAADNGVSTQCSGAPVLITPQHLSHAIQLPFSCHVPRL